MDEETVVDEDFDESEESEIEPSDEDTESAEQPTEETEAEGLSDDAADEDEDEDELEGESDEAKEAWRNLPPAIRKQAQGVITRKLQRVGRLRRYETFLDQLEKDPAAAARQLAGLTGLKLEEPNQVITPSAEERLQKRLADLVGEDGAKMLAPVLKEFVEEATKSSHKPLQEALEKVTQDSIAASSESDYRAFLARHPDAAPGSPVEKAMLAAAQRIEPRGTVPVDQYLDDLYRLATRDTAGAAGARKMVEKGRKAAAAAEPKSSAVPSSEVSVKPGKLPSFKEAADAAKKGVRFDFTS